MKSIIAIFGILIGFALLAILILLFSAFRNGEIESADDRGIFALLIALVQLIFNFLFLNKFGFQRIPKLFQFKIWKILFRANLVLLIGLTIYGIANLFIGNKINNGNGKEKINKSYIILDSTFSASGFYGVLKIKKRQSGVDYQVNIGKNKDDIEFKNFHYMVELLDSDGFLIDKFQLSQYIFLVDSNNRRSEIVSKGFLSLPHSDLERLKKWDLAVSIR